jgi:hypothetical protein
MHRFSERGCSVASLRTQYTPLVIDGVYRLARVPCPCLCPCCPVRAAYRRTCLEAHPDKALAGIDDAAEKIRIEERFKTIQARTRGA